MSSAYTDVHHVDAIVAEHGANWSDLPDKAGLGPVDQSYSQREVIIRGPDGNLVTLDQGIGPNAGEGRLSSLRRRRADRPGEAERVGHLAVAVTPELVG